MSDIYLARQAIFNNSFQLHGYELLFRNQSQNNAVFDIDAQATSQVFLSSYIDIGLNKLIGDYECYFHTDFENIKNLADISADNSKLSLEFSANLIYSKQEFLTLDELKRQGFKLVLAHYHPDKQDPELLNHFDQIKCNTQQLSQPHLIQAARQATQYKCQLIATHIENYQQINKLKEHGFDFFQGFFLNKPDITQQKNVPTNLLPVIQTLTNILNPELELSELENYIASDVSLSYRVLRLLNSASYQKTDIDSISRAIIYLGRKAIKNLLITIILSGVDDKPTELTRIALVRAKMCNIMACHVGQENGDSYFTLGLLSILDAMLDQPMADILPKLPVNDELKNGLAQQSGAMGTTLQCVIEYEECRLYENNNSSLNTSELNEFYTQAVEWADKTFTGLTLN